MHVIGIIAVDQHQNIATAKGMPITFDCPKHIKRLDQMILRHALRNEVRDVSTVVCIGENTYESLRGTLMMGILNESSCILVVSGQTQVRVIRTDAYRPHEVLDTIHFEAGMPKNDSKDIATATAYTWALKSEHFPRIVVLGGVSVYDMFYGNYDEIHSVEVNSTEISKGTKTLNFPIKEMLKESNDELVRKVSTVISMNELEYIHHYMECV